MQPANLKGVFLLLTCVWLVAAFRPPPSLAVRKRTLPSALQESRERWAARHSPASSQLSIRSLSSSNACGDLVNAYINDGTYRFNAVDVYQCQISVPFNATAATSLLKYYRETLEFQSTLSYLKNPPTAYQQTSVDLIQGLDFIESQIAVGGYSNQYVFESALQRLVYNAHDTHLSLDAGIMSIFTFGSPVTIVSVSEDGFQMPKPYIRSDLVSSQGQSWMASAIASINGMSAVTYLERYARLHAFGGLEPHTDFNLLMDSVAADIQWDVSYFDVLSPFYPGDSLNIQLENGTALPPQQFQAVAQFYAFDNISQVDMSPQDFYNYFVFLPSDDDSAPSDSTDASSSSILSVSPTSTVDGVVATLDVSSALVTQTASPSLLPVSEVTGAYVAPDGYDVITNWTYFSGITAYPSNPAISQTDLGYGGYVTGYLLHESQVAVLSIPSFVADGDLLTSFSNTIERFLNLSRAAGMSKIVIDLQQNLGGNALLALDTFKHFFPELEPFAGSRMRSSTMSDAIGNTLTGYFRRLLDNPAELNQTYLDALINDPFAPLNFLDTSTGMRFADWPEFFGPHADRGDLFSTVQRPNLTDSNFTVVATSSAEDDSDGDAALEGITIFGYGNRKPQSLAAAYAPQDIVLLTDATCASACALFVETMTKVGAKTVVVGGRPIIGPMQAVGGTRGAEVYDAASLDADMYFASQWNATAAQSLPQDRVDLNYTVYNAAFNLRDQIREGEYQPLQFAYEAADCRIFFTKANFNNYTRLWQDAADAIWSKPYLCVEDSTGYTTPFTNMDGPTPAQKAAWERGLDAHSANTAHFMPYTALPETWDNETMSLYDQDHVLLLPNGLEDSTSLRGHAPSKNTHKATSNSCTSQCSGCQFVFTCGRTADGGVRYNVNPRGSCSQSCSDSCAVGFCNKQALECTAGSCYGAQSCNVPDFFDRRCSDTRVIEAARRKALMFARDQLPLRVTIKIRIPGAGDHYTI